MLILLVALLASTPGDRPIDEAAAHATRHELTEARKLLETTIEHEPVPAGALFVLACVELEDGRYARASELAGRLARAVPGSGEAKVLAALIERRQKDPDARWTRIAADAWHGAGRPALSGALVGPSASPPLVVEPTPPIVEPASARRAGATSRVEPALRAKRSRAALLRAVGAMNEGYGVLADAAFEEARAADLPLAAGLAAVRVLLDESVPAARRPRARAAAETILARLARARPDDGHLLADHVLRQTPEEAPLSEAELVRLEAAVKAATFRLPFRELHAEFKVAYEEVDPAGAEARAFTGLWSAMPVMIHHLLSRRAFATTAPELRRRALAVAALAGARLASGSTIVEQMVGTSLQIQVAGAGHDIAAIALLEKRRHDLEETRRVVLGFWQANWPLASLFEEHIARAVEDEVRYFEEFARRR